MSDFKLMIVEDNDEELELCRGCVADFETDKACEVELVECKSVKEAFASLDNSFDAAIIDLTLADEGGDGNQVMSRIEKTHLRIPVAILTGTPDNADGDFGYIGVFKKGEIGAGYADLLDHFWRIHNTGLTRIMGGRGIIEETLHKVFKENLLLQKDKWVAYGAVDSSRTERALLRHALSHLFQRLADDGELYFPEEVYLSPPYLENIRTGSIVKRKTADQWFVVMNPACDLVIRAGGTCTTDRILIVEIDSQGLLFPGHPEIDLTRSQKNDLEKAFKNNKSTYYHWLPKTDIFEGGFLNFRKLRTLSRDEFNEGFEPPGVQISQSFVKDIVARFSAYYARQGQPDIDYDHFINSPQLQ